VTPEGGHPELQIGNEEEEERPGVEIDGGLVGGLVVEVDGNLIRMENDGAQARFSAEGWGSGCITTSSSSSLVRGAETGQEER
jgi:hypothetical protein